MAKIINKKLISIVFIIIMAYGCGGGGGGSSAPAQDTVISGNA